MRAPLRLILTRVPEDNAILRELLSDLDPQGVEMVDLPCLKIEHLPLAEPVLKQLREAYFEAVVFVSKPSVRALLGERTAEALSLGGRTSGEQDFGVLNPGVQNPGDPNPGIQNPDLPNPPLVIGIGIGTREEIEQRGWKVSAIPSEPRAEVAVQELDWLIPGNGPVLHVRGDIGASLIQNALRERGREVVDTVVYRNTAPDIPAPKADPRPTLLLATSPSVFRRAIALIPEPRNIEVLAIGETTARVSRASGLPTHLAPESSPSGLAAGIRRWLEGR